MILVRDIFQLKFGKAKDVKALWPQMKTLEKELGYGPSRALFDVTGRYYTFVMEPTHDSLAAFGKMYAEETRSPEFSAWYQKFVPPVESGRREMFTVVD